MAAPKPPRPLPMQPVLDRLADRRCPLGGHEHFGCAAAVAWALNITRKSVHRYKTEGLSVIAADRLAARLDAHPAELWGSAAWERANTLHEEELERQARHRREQRMVRA